MSDWLRMIGFFLLATGVFLTFDIEDLLESIKRDNDQRKAREELFHTLTVTTDAPDFPRISPKETRW